MQGSSDIRRLTDLSLLDRIALTQLTDLLGRPMNLTLPLASDLSQLYAVAYSDNKLTGWIRYSPRKLLLYRDPKTTLEQLFPAGLIEFPTTEHLDQDTWKALISFALEEFFRFGISWAGIYLPPDYRHYISAITSLGFDRFADCDSLAFLRPFGFDRACTLFKRRCAAARGFRRPDLLPWLSRSNILYSTNLTTAPEPDSTFWSRSIIYSGYSIYPWLTDFLGIVLDSDVHSVLSIPCATADVFRLAPASFLTNLERCVGVDIVERNIDFGLARLKDPNIDILNMLLCHIFFAHRTGLLEGSIDHFLIRLAKLANRELELREAKEYYLQLDAAFAEVVLAGAFTDWFVLLKGFSRLMAISPKPGMFVNTDEDVDIGFSDCIAFAQQVGENEIRSLLDEIGKIHIFQDEMEKGRLGQLLLRKGSIDLSCSDMFDLKITDIYDTVVVMEAALMIVGSGRETAFLDVVSDAVKSGGQIVVTGIAAEHDSVALELTVLERLFEERGFRTAQVKVRPNPGRWAFGFVPRLSIPVLLAEKR